MIEMYQERYWKRSFLLQELPPSGANKQPWTFCLISDPKIKQKIRKAAEEEERISYESRMTETWKSDLKPLGTDWEKPFLEIAPYLVVVFKQSYGMEGEEKNPTLLCK